MKVTERKDFALQVIDETDENHENVENNTPIGTGMSKSVDAYVLQYVVQTCG